MIYSTRVKARRFRFYPPPEHIVPPAEM